MNKLNACLGIKYVIHSLIAVDHFSKVTIDLQQEPTSTKLTLVQTEVPEAELEQTKQGWKRYIFDPAKVILGMGLAPL